MCAWKQDCLPLNSLSALQEELEEKVAKEKAKLEALRAEAEGAGQSAEEHRRQLDAERAARAAAERRADKAQRELDAAEARGRRSSSLPPLLPRCLGALLGPSLTGHPVVSPSARPFPLAPQGALLAERQKRAAAEDLAERRADVEKRAALDVAEAQEAARAASERHRVLVSAIGAPNPPGLRTPPPVPPVAHGVAGDRRAVTRSTD